MDMETVLCLGDKVHCVCFFPKSYMQKYVGLPKWQYRPFNIPPSSLPLRECLRLLMIARIYFSGFRWQDNWDVWLLNSIYSSDFCILPLGYSSKIHQSFSPSVLLKLFCILWKSIESTSVFSVNRNLGRSFLRQKTLRMAISLQAGKVICLPRAAGTMWTPSRMVSFICLFIYIPHTPLCLEIHAFSQRVGKYSLIT